MDTCQKFNLNSRIFSSIFTAYKNSANLIFPPTFQYKIDKIIPFFYIGITNIVIFCPSVVEFLFFIISLT